ncbi:hypothetical protein HPG69_002049, partial [Diceros bicornis minor]
VSPDKTMYETNYSEASHFVFLGLSTSRPLQHFLLAFSTVFYVTIVLGNLFIVFTVTFDPHLRYSMYFLLANLSFIDLCLSTLTVPKMISDLYSGHKTTSFQGCPPDNTYRMGFVVTANEFISMGTFFLLIISCIFILVTVWKCSSGGLPKALSTLSAHITVVVLFFGLCILVYMWPFPTVSVDKFLAILDFMIISILNPVIYVLRDKDMKTAMRKLE